MSFMHTVLLLLSSGISHFLFSLKVIFALFRLVLYPKYLAVSRLFDTIE